MEILMKKTGINGEGIGYIHRKPVFVESALQGELCEIEIEKEFEKVKQDENFTKEYLYYYLLSHNKDIIKCKKEGGVPAVNRSDLCKIKICIPSIAEQKRIVDILDKFDALVNDISDVLPAEINARRQQYEYYRDKLLSFPMAT